MSHPHEWSHHLNTVAAQDSEIRIRTPAVSPMASSAAEDPEDPDKPEVEQPDHPVGPVESHTRTNTPDRQAPQTTNQAEPQDTAQSQQTDKPWSPKDTFKWMINILRCHNALASSHIRLQAEVNQLRQDMIEAAKHPVPPIWSQEGAEAFSTNTERLSIRTGDHCTTPYHTRLGHSTHTRARRHTIRSGRSTRSTSTHHTA